MLLTDEERRRFAEYLEQDAESSRLIIAQMEAMPNVEMMTRNIKIEMHAALIIARKLRDVESQTIRATR